MGNEYVEVVDIIDRHLRAMVTDLRRLAAKGAIDDEEGRELSATDEWTSVGCLPRQTYDWPPDNGGRDEYDPFEVYRSNGMTLALAQNVKPTWVKERERKQIWVMKCDADGGHKRPISPFIATDDYDETQEMVAIIRGNGEYGRAMYEPGTRLPAPYDDPLKTDVLGNRVSGHYNRLAVVAHEDDSESMLLHGAAQIVMRRW